MSDLSKVRTLIKDTPLYAKQEFIVDGIQLSIQVDYFPVVEESVTVTGTDVPAFTLDQDNGVLTFENAPDEQILTVEYKHVCMLDSEISEILDINADTIDPVRLSSADCLDAIASSQALIQKKIKLLDLETDGPALALALRKHASVMRDLVFTLDEPSFDIIELVYNTPSRREKILKDFERENA